MDTLPAPNFGATNTAWPAGNPPVATELIAAYASSTVAAGQFVIHFGTEAPGTEWTSPSPPTWDALAAGVEQLAQLLERLMADVYGAQHWLARGVLPPALVQAQPGYLRALHAALPVGARYLHLVACDLACTPDGFWHVVGLGTQAPSGLAWLLHERLAPGFRGLRDTLLNPASDTNHLVLLTPGPYARAYGEHAALAQGLGLSLAQGCDLQVRRQRLVLNTLDGPVPVHGLIKMVDDAFIDPLELRADSTLGVPGLVQLLRSNSLVVANRPGCAFLENPALLAYL
ncbi:circularly permuted type 2 ATP-grasp protein, partial [Acidovorax temperans]|uniref:circularly permuted type 2 ATP-grasp protein n=1 Tax=Acidovorax temperans TaxID=80878 RepID=UPI0035AF2779